MADTYDKHGRNSSDFKRNVQQDQNPENESSQGDENTAKLNNKASEYMKELLSEKIKLNSAQFPVSSKLLDEEVSRLQNTGRVPPQNAKYVDVYNERPIKVSVKVLVPVKEFPKFNFVGNLLGPKGNTLKQLQEETMCKMAVLGRRSMRDQEKEEELRKSLDPKYSHLMDELHVEISALAPPAEAHSRIAYALAEVKKYLIPETEDTMWQPPMREFERGIRPGPGGLPLRPPPRGPPRMAPPPPMPRGLPAKNKVISILDRARSAMETSYTYEDPYAAPPEPQIRGPPRAAAPESDFYYERTSHDRFYEDDAYYKDEPPQRTEYKASARDVGTRRAAPAHHSRNNYPRATPYGRPPK